MHTTERCARFLSGLHLGFQRDFRPHSFKCVVALLGCADLTTQAQVVFPNDTMLSTFDPSFIQHILPRFCPDWYTKVRWAWDWACLVHQTYVMMQCRRFFNSGFKCQNYWKAGNFFIQAWAQFFPRPHQPTINRDNTKKRSLPERQNLMNSVVYVGPYSYTWIPEYDQSAD